MAVNIDFTKAETDSAVPENITKPAIKKAFLKLAKKKQEKKLTVKEARQYQRLKRQGDNVQALASITGNKPTPPVNLEELNNLPTPSHNKLKLVIDSVYNGINPITACKQLNIAPKEFYKEIEKQENFALKVEFFRARCLLAEYYLERRESLEEDLKHGRIDSSAYSCLSSDYKYLAGKLAPLAYGDKIRLDITTETRDSAPDNNTLAELNNLINGGELKPIN